MNAEPSPAYPPSTRAVAVALHQMTVEDNPGHIEWTDCGWSETTPCFAEGVRLVEELHLRGWRVVSGG